MNYASSSRNLALARVTNYAPEVMLQIMVSLTVVIYDRKMFIKETTD